MATKKEFELMETKCPSCGRDISNSSNKNICSYCGVEAPSAQCFANINAYMAWYTAVLSTKVRLENRTAPVKVPVSNTSKSTSNSENLELPGPVPTSKDTNPYTTETPIKTPNSKKKSNLKFAWIFMVLVVVVIGAVAVFNMMDDGNSSKTKSKGGGSKKDANQTVETTTRSTTAATTKTTTANTTQNTTKKTSSTTEPVVEDLCDYKALPVAYDVVDENNVDGVLVITSFNEDLKYIVEKYSDVTVDSWGILANDGSAYERYLDQVLSTGENAPDMIACDYYYAKKFVNSSKTLPVNDLGINYDELYEAYNYTLQLGSDDENVIKALTWEAWPAGVFYNRTVAEKTLGVYEPEDIAPYFATWDAVLDTGRFVAETGDFRVIAGNDEIYRNLMYNRNRLWVTDYNLNPDYSMEEFFDIALNLKEDNLTWNYSTWSDGYLSSASNETVLSYWGPMWLGSILGMDDANRNPTSGDWGFVPSPTPYHWGGTWIMATKYCDKSASVAQIMRDIAINPSTLQGMAADRRIMVNNIPIMTSISNDSNFNLSWLGGQNPYGYLNEIAKIIDGSVDYINEDEVADTFFLVVDKYCAGCYVSRDEAEQDFKSNLIALGIING